MPRLSVRHSVLKVESVVPCDNDITPSQKQIHKVMQVESTPAKDRYYDLRSADH